MVEIATARVSAKRQVVIPNSLNWDIVEGDTLVFVKDNEQVIIKKASAMDKQFAQDKAFSQGIRKAYQDVDAGRVRTYASLEEFRKRLLNG
ncbi:AbrB/MazE/SpoVT family DNA-binding domain-containing protein [Candidatus Pacearchaeota archaeon]|nr:AbrB/MazE/SpoVT family DNA-binding domain-containing protein [Candidatus Pacearchaeota archaeon]